jgi:hypothetical protein
MLDLKPRAMYRCHEGRATGRLCRSRVLHPAHAAQWRGLWTVITLRSTDALHLQTLSFSTVVDS